MCTNACCDACNPRWVNKNQEKVSEPRRPRDSVFSRYNTPPEDSQAVKSARSFVKWPDSDNEDEHLDNSGSEARFKADIAAALAAHPGSKGMKVVGVQQLSPTCMTAVASSTLIMHQYLAAAQILEMRQRHQLPMVTRAEIRLSWWQMHGQ